VVHTSTVESKISGPDNKVGILALHVSVTEWERVSFEN
jgi:hypothetical protein